MKLLPGETIQNAVRRMLREAERSGQKVEAVFNGVRITANPGDKAENLVTSYLNTKDRDFMMSL